MIKLFIKLKEMKINGVAKWQPEKGLSDYDRSVVAIIKNGRGDLLFHERDLSARLTPGKIILWGGSPQKLTHTPNETIINKLKNKLGLEIDINQLNFVDTFCKIKCRHDIDGKVYVYSIHLPGEMNISPISGKLFSVSEEKIKRCLELDTLSVEPPIFSDFPEYQKFSLLTREILKTFFHRGRVFI